MKPAENCNRNGNILAKCEYFTVEEIVVNERTEIEITDKSFKSVIVADGEGQLSMGEM